MCPLFLPAILGMSLTEIAAVLDALKQIQRSRVVLMLDLHLRLVMGIIIPSPLKATVPLLGPRGGDMWRCLAA